MHWTLADLRSMDSEEYDALIDWAQKKGKDPESFDADEIVEAKRREDTKPDV
jgi:hypothetical protein